MSGVRCERCEVRVRCAEFLTPLGTWIWNSEEFNKPNGQINFLKFSRACWKMKIKMNEIREDRS